MLKVLGVAVTYKVRPSQLLQICDPYTAYCLDEACAFILAELKDGKEPIIPKKDEEPIMKHYSTPSELYKQYDN